MLDINEALDQACVRILLREHRRQRDGHHVVRRSDWNFDVRGFNPGGNHGSFFRVSTNSTFMIAGGAKTGIPRGLVVDEPYDGLSFTPTILRLMGIDHEKLTYRFQGRYYRLTDVHGSVVNGLLA